MKVNLFIPCFVDQFSPETGFNMVKVLERFGCQVNYNPEQTCCGLPAFHAGHWEDAREVGEKLLNEVSTDKNLVCAAASCTGMIRNSYDLLFQNSSYHNKYRQIQKRTFELSEFLIDVLKVEQTGAKLNGRAAFLDSCQGLHQCKIKEQPRILLKTVEDLELVELEDSETCCGFGGTFSVNYEPMSIELANLKLRQVSNAGASIIISTDYSCLLHLDGVIRKQNLPLRVMHLADVLASGW